MKPGDRLVCSFIKDIDRGTRFKAWPLHLTIVPWFRAEEPLKKLEDGLAGSIKGIKEFTATAGETAFFGHKKSKEVTLIDQPSAYSDLEKSVRAYLKSLSAWIVDESTKRKPVFRPHVTAQEGKKLNQ